MLELTREQEEILLKMIQTEANKPALELAAKTAQAELDEATQRLIAEREVEESASNDRIMAINIKYTAEIATKLDAVRDTVLALSTPSDMRARG